MRYAILHKDIEGAPAFPTAEAAQEAADALAPFAPGILVVPVDETHTVVNVADSSTLTAENYFEYHPNCYHSCRIARGDIGRGERHDPRCQVSTSVGYPERERIAQDAEKIMFRPPRSARR